MVIIVRKVEQKLSLPTMSADLTSSEHIVSFLIYLKLAIRGEGLADFKILYFYNIDCSNKLKMETLTF